jgi:hypothetical protein
MIISIKTISRIKYKILIKNANLTGDSFEEFNRNCKIFVDAIAKWILELSEKPQSLQNIISCQHGLVTEWDSNLRL